MYTAQGRKEQFSSDTFCCSWEKIRSILSCVKSVVCTLREDQPLRIVDNTNVLFDNLGSQQIQQGFLVLAG